jgi:hypothetical protein
MYGQADVTKTFSGKGISNKPFSTALIKITRAKFSQKRQTLLGKN